jgi:hypothetical protein
MPSHIYQNIVNLVVRLPIRCPSKFMNVTIWEHRTFDSKIFGYYIVKSVITNMATVTNFESYIQQI